MDASNPKALQVFDVGPFEQPYELGCLIGRRFSDMIKSRVARDLILQEELLPFAGTSEAQPLIESLSATTRQRFPRYWDELMGIAHGSGVSSLDIILLNLRNEILPFAVKKKKIDREESSNEDCSDVLVVNDSLAIAAHNEDANVALVGHTYLVRVALPSGLTFTAYTYAGELPSCAFGFNSHGLAFTLNSVPPVDEEIVAEGIGRNFISRDLLEATGIDDALSRIRSSNASVGHSYNLIDVVGRKILNVETASKGRSSIIEVGKKPFFHANMYLHLEVQQVQNENSICRQKRAALVSAATDSKAAALSTLGDTGDEKFPIYMTGPTLYTLCTALIDLDERTLAIFQGNPKGGEVCYLAQI